MGENLVKPVAVCFPFRVFDVENSSVENIPRNALRCILASNQHQRMKENEWGRGYPPCSLFANSILSFSFFVLSSVPLERNFSVKPYSFPAEVTQQCLWPVETSRLEPFLSPSPKLWKGPEAWVLVLGLSITGPVALVSPCPLALQLLMCKRGNWIYIYSEVALAPHILGLSHSRPLFLGGRQHRVKEGVFLCQGSPPSDSSLFLNVCDGC